MRAIKRFNYLKGIRMCVGKPEVATRRSNSVISFTLFFEARPGIAPGAQVLFRLDQTG